MSNLSFKLTRQDKYLRYRLTYLTLIGFVHDDHGVVQVDKFPVENVVSNDQQWSVAPIIGEGQISYQFATHVNVAASRL